MRRLLWLALLPASLSAQRPAVSPVLPRVWARDTVISVWLFVRSGTSLQAVAARAAGLGARIRVQSRWLHAISVDAPTAALRALASDHDLRRVQPLGRFRLAPRVTVELLSPRPAPAAPGDTCPAGGDPALGPSEMPYRQLHLRPLTDAGVDGTGVRIAIFDSGFDTQNAAFTGITVTAQYDFVFGDTIVRNEAADAPSAQFHGTAVWSLFAGDVPGRLHGVARGATYLLAKTEDIRSETRVEEDNYVAALEWAGNSGPGARTLWTPADGDSVLAAGAEDSLGTLANFSSRGPTADGRIKPDFTAPGVDVCVVTGAGVVRRLNGTSFATPLLAASAALVRQMHPTMAPMALRAAFRRWATNRAAPDTFRGWGRPDVAAAATFPVGVTPIAPVTGPLASVTPTFTWTVGDVPPAATPVRYQLRIARDSSGPPLVDTTLTGVETYDLRIPLKPGAPLLWRVDATAATGDTASTGVIGPIGVPAWATLTSLTSPAGATTDSVQPTFTWTSPTIAAPPGPFSYDLFVQRVSEPLPDIGAAGLTTTSFRILEPLERNTAYHWYLVTHAGSDTSLTVSRGSFLVLDASTPAATLLYQNFPNPFPAAGRDSTCLWFDLATTGIVQVDILDLRGNTVRRFVPGRDFPPILSAGRYGRGPAGGATCDPRLMWDGRAADGRLLPAGVYLYKLKAPGIVLFKRIVFRGK